MLQLKDIETSGKKGGKEEGREGGRKGKPEFHQPTCPSLPPSLPPSSVEFDLMLPYGSSSYTTLENIAQGFGGPGMVFPFKLLFIDR